MDEVKHRLGQVIGLQVETAHLDPIAREPVEQARVEIHGQDRTSAPHPVGKHPRDRASPGADIQAAPAIGDADCVQLTDAHRVVELLEQPQPRPLHIG